MKATSDDSDWTIEFKIEGVPEPIHLHIESEATIGRIDPNQMVFNGLDLTPYRGEELGVSRQHAIIRLKGDDLVISDLHSSNGTMLNGTRLQPEQESCLNDGDLLIIGHVKMKLRINNDLGWSSIRGQRTQLALRKLPIKGHGQRILVVEDDIGYSDLYRNSLEQAGYTVQLCREVVSAIRTLNVTAPSLILLDLMLPSIHGLELCRYVRRDTENPRIPVVVVSAATEEGVEQALDAGADICLGKPINIKELSRIVSALIHKGEMENPALGTKQLSATASLENLPVRPGKDAVVIFIEGHREPIGISVDSQLLLGRSIGSQAGYTVTTIDLDPYGAFDKGVSRTHARIVRQDSTFLIEDLGSSNGTFVNGKGLRPHQSVLLNNGDEIRLGELRLGIYLLGAGNAAVSASMPSSN